MAIKVPHDFRFLPDFSLDEKNSPGLKFDRFWKPHFASLMDHRSCHILLLNISCGSSQAAFCFNYKDLKSLGQKSNPCLTHLTSLVQFLIRYNPFLVLLFNALRNPKNSFFTSIHPSTKGYNFWYDLMYTLHYFL